MQQPACLERTAIQQLNLECVRKMVGENERYYWEAFYFTRAMLFWFCDGTAGTAMTGWLKGMCSVPVWIKAEAGHSLFTFFLGMAACAKLPVTVVQQH